MNAVDAVVIAVVLLAALRGYWRGFFRELFGLLAIAAGIAAAFVWSGDVSALLVGTVPGPQQIRDALAFVAVFVGAHVAVNLVGFLLDRLAGVLLLGGVNRVVGLAFGAAKGAAVAAIVLLFVHLFPPLSKLDEQVMSSSVARPLVIAATDVLRFGRPVQVEQPGQAPQPGDEG